MITATVLAMRADSGAARRHADRALATVDPAENGLIAARARRALGVAALADGNYLQAFAQLRGLFSEDGTPLHNYASYLGVAISPPPRSAPTGGRKDATSSSTHSAASTGRPLPGSSSSSPAHAVSSPTQPTQRHISERRSLTPRGTSGHSSGPSFASTTPNGCGAAAGSTTPSPSSWRRWEPSGGSVPGHGRNGRTQS